MRHWLRNMLINYSGSEDMPEHAGCVIVDENDGK